MHRQFAVIGLGYFGSTVARELRRHDHEVLGVDADEKRLNAVADLLNQAVIADPTDEHALQELGLEQYDAVLIDLADSMEQSLICALLAKELGARELWVKATSDAHHKLLSRLGVDHIVHPEYDLGVRVAESLAYHAMVDFIHLGDHQFVVELEVSARLGDDCQQLDQLPIDDDISVIALRKGKTLDRQPSGSTRLSAGDHLVLIGELSALRKLGAHL
ncbi:MAG: potassium transporter TrkA [Cobetia sp.]|uniref:TrkA family potassium uptake protein n=1 Tax=Cobetia amphilecti TaxID=1055104 RepID=A0AAP4U254_9GAMM|nr:MULTISPECIES: TrkA family potassium uptake protein [Cobetia]AVV35027.1 TrkA family potassium uptake protein [Halomonas sp. SF2003]UTV86481.1 TrkA family potassium uptake protein [Cobetia litoralis]MBF09081.1 potassium transporter TrkA [Cobetia sp.]MBK09506.1 potassium transporter TrkA [Cobetia sp.]MDH2293986.1 TrkA family potassium uptake protein [Cobetia sp. 1AS1]|tara:strand:- start:13808 stop:14461 length:654 start_codon:yes stop_codon:yes gene_type:complete